MSTEPDIPPPTMSTEPDIPPPTMSTEPDIPPPTMSTEPDIPPPTMSTEPDIPPPTMSTEPDIPPPTMSTEPDIPPPTMSTGPDIPPPTMSTGPDIPPPTMSTGPDIPPPTMSTGPDIPPPTMSTEPDIPPPKEQGAVLTILHFNDVYEIEARAEEPVGGAARFATAVKEFQALNPFVVFSGDCLSPSLLSTITKGKHMVDILNKLGVHCAVYGNHEFDFGVDLLEELIPQTTFPWFLSNVYDRFTNEPLGHGIASSVVEWNGVKIGLMGLVEEDWLDTLGTVDKSSLRYVDYVETADRLSAELRQQQADLVIALTHMRWHNDIRLASDCKGLDLILGGHDHEYGVLEVNGILIVKSGSEFRYLSKIDVVRDQDMTFHYICHKISTMKRLEEDAEIKQIVNRYSGNAQHMLGEVLCHTDVDLDGRIATARRGECSLGNLITNAMLEATHAEVAILNSGSLRSDRVHPAGPLTRRDLLQILPITDLVLVVEVTGQRLYQALENGVRNYPALDGRFPQVAGIQFGFDPSRKPGQRIVAETVKVQGKSLDRERTYSVAMKEYLTKGKDGYTMFQGCPWRFDLENAQILSTILINHFESGQIVRGLKACKSGHRMGLITVSSSPSVAAIEKSVSEKLSGEAVGVAVVPGVEGRIFHVFTESQSETEG